LVDVIFFINSAVADSYARRAIETDEEVFAATAKSEIFTLKGEQSE
jgi:hypothetical protein